MTADLVRMPEIVQWILDRRRSGLSYRAIAAKLNENGAPTKYGTVEPDLFMEARGIEP